MSDVCLHVKLALNSILLIKAKYDFHHHCFIESVKSESQPMNHEPLSLSVIMHLNLLLHGEQFKSLFHNKQSICL